MKNPYNILGVAEDATYQEIRKAYRTLSKEVHPDKDPDNKKNTEDFIELNKAWEILKDPIKKKLYDEKGRVEDTMSKQSVYNEIYALFFAIITQDPEAYKKDIIMVILDEIDANLVESKSKIRPLLESIKEIEKYKGKIKLKNKDDHDNIFEDLIDGRIKSIQEEITYWETFPEKLHKLKGVVNMYESPVRDFRNMSSITNTI